MSQVSEGYKDWESTYSAILDNPSRVLLATLIVDLIEQGVAAQISHELPFEISVDLSLKHGWVSVDFGISDVKNPVENQIVEFQGVTVGERGIIGYLNKDSTKSYLDDDVREENGKFPQMFWLATNEMGSNGDEIKSIHLRLKLGNGEVKEVYIPLTELLNVENSYLKMGEGESIEDIEMRVITQRLRNFIDAYQREKQERDEAKDESRALTGGSLISVGEQTMSIDKMRLLLSEDIYRLKSLNESFYQKGEFKKVVINELVTATAILEEVNKLTSKERF